MPWQNAVPSLDPSDGSGLAGPTSKVKRGPTRHPAFGLALVSQWRPCQVRPSDDIIAQHRTMGLGELRPRRSRPLRRCDDVMAAGHGTTGTEQQARNAWFACWRSGVPGWEQGTAIGLCWNRDAQRRSPLTPSHFLPLIALCLFIKLSSPVSLALVCPFISHLNCKQQSTTQQTTNSLSINLETPTPSVFRPQTRQHVSSL